MKTLQETSNHVTHDTFYDQLKSENYIDNFTQVSCSDA